MKGLFNIIAIGAFAIFALMLAGVVDEEKLTEIFMGEVEMGETEQKYKEEDFIHVFDVILGEMEVHDTSRTEFKRQRNFFNCESAYVVNETHATIKYEVRTSPDIFFVDVEKMEYYVSPNLGVTYHEAEKSTKMNIEESSCIKEKNIKNRDIERSKQIAERNFKKAVQKSDKLIEAKARFEVIKENLLDKLVDAGFKEVLPRERAFMD